MLNFLDLDKTNPFGNEACRTELSFEIWETLSRQTTYLFHQVILYSNGISKLWRMGFTFCHFAGNKCATLRSHTQRGIQALAQRGELQGRHRGRSLVFHRKQWRICQDISCQDRTGVRHEHQTWYFERSAAAVHWGTFDRPFWGMRLLNFVVNDVTEVWFLLGVMSLKINSSVSSQLMRIRQIINCYKKIHNSSIISLLIGKF